MKITGVNINRPLNRTQGSIKKIDSLSKPLNMGVGQVSSQLTNEIEDSLDTNGRKPKKPVRKLGKNVDLEA
jgi:hypothetical protein